MAVTIFIEDIVTGEAWAYPCDRSPIIVGRARSATISIARAFISSLHATIRYDEQQITYTDLDSLNGTLLDGQPIGTDRPVKILPESELVLGKRLRLTVHRGAAAEPPDPKVKNPFDAESRPPGAPPARVATNVLSAEELDEIARARNAKEAAVALVAARDALPAKAPAGPPVMSARPAPEGLAFRSELEPNARDQVAVPEPVEVRVEPTPATAAAPEPELEPGLLPPKTRLGRYYIVRLVARGGMGAVYRAEDPETEQAVAIKTLAPDLASKPDARARFLREAKVACRVAHRNIIKIFGYDIHDGIPYLIMEYLRGEGLHALLDRGPLAIDRVAGIGAAVCAGMSAVHEHGIIHRDLKPSNIFLADTDEGQLVKVLDFGVSKSQASRDPFRTGMNAIIGSLPYMSPEQAMGGVELDARSDQFSLGVILYECLTGHRPHRGETPYTLSENIVHGRFEPPIASRPEIPPALNDVIMKSMSTAPSDRYESLRELGIDLLPFSSAQAQRQLTDLLSGGPHRMSRAQMSAPIPADWYESVRSPTPPGKRPLPRTETGVVETGESYGRPGGIQALVGRTQILVEGDEPGALERWGRRATPPTQPGALVPYAPVAQPGVDGPLASGRRSRSVSLWQAAVFIAVGFAMGAVALWFVSPRSRDVERPASAEPATAQVSPPPPPAPPPAAKLTVAPSMPPTIMPAAIAPPPAAVPHVVAPAPPAVPVPAPRPAPVMETSAPSHRPIARHAPPREQPATVARRERKRPTPRQKPAPSTATEEPARTKNGVRILE